MSRRTGIALLVITLWLAGIAALGHRELFRDDGHRFAMAGLLVSPGADFYELSRDGEHLGFSSFTVDTTAAGLELTEYSVYDLSRRDGIPVRMSRRYRVETTRSLKLLRFQLDEQYGTIIRTVLGRVEGDSSLVVETRSGDRQTEERLRLEHPILPTSAVPLALALVREPRVGRTYDFATLDPVEMRPSAVRLRVVAESLMVFADSSTFDDGTGRWVPARRDSVRAWRVEQYPTGPLTGWIDQQGRLMDREIDGGIRERRTAYEMAYLNWPGSRFRRTAMTGPAEPADTNLASQ